MENVLPLNFTKITGTHLGYFFFGTSPCELDERVFAPFLDPARVPWDGTDSNSSSGIGREAAWCVCTWTEVGPNQLLGGNWYDKVTI